MDIRHLIIILFIIVGLIFLGQGIATSPFKITVILTIGVIFSILTLINFELSLYLLIFVIPFTQQFMLGRVTKYAPIDIGTDDVFILFMILSWLVNLVRKKEPAFLKTSLNWPFVAFFVVSVFSFIGAYARLGEGAVLLGLLHLFKFYEYVFIYFIVISAIDDLKQIKKFVLMSFIIVGFIAITQFISMFALGHISLSKLPPAGALWLKPMESFVSNSILGAYYGFFISILLAIILIISALKHRAGLVLFATLLSFALFNTYSRSSYLGFFVGFLILAILKEKKFFLLILLAAIFSPLFIQPAVLGRITLTLASWKPISFDPSAAIRIVIWKKALASFLMNPFIGTGYWTTRWVLNSEAHSQYLAFLVDTGLIGLSVFCWLIVRMYKNSILLVKQADTDFLKALGIGYIAGLSAILVTCFFSETLESFQMTGPLWFVTGLITSANRLLSEKSQHSYTDST